MTPMVLAPTPAAAKPKLIKSKPLGWQVRRVVPILYDEYPPAGIPPARVTPNESYARVVKVLAERKEPAVSRDSVRRAILAIKRGDA
jgi:hypothetical protein